MSEMGIKSSRILAMELDGISVMLADLQSRFKEFYGVTVDYSTECEILRQAATRIRRQEEKISERAATIEHTEEIAPYFNTHGWKNGDLVTATFDGQLFAGYLRWRGDHWSSEKVVPTGQQESKEEGIDNE